MLAVSSSISTLQNQIDTVLGIWSMRLEANFSKQAKSISATPSHGRNRQQIECRTQSPWEERKSTAYPRPAISHVLIATRRDYA